MDEMTGEVSLNCGAQASLGSEQENCGTAAHKADLSFSLSFCLGSSHQTWMQYALFFYADVRQTLSRN